MFRLRPKLTAPSADFFWPIATLAGVVLALLVGGVFALLAQFDADAKMREEIVVRNGLQGRIEEVAHMVVPQAVWDDAVRNLDNRYDAAWARDNIGQFLSQADGFDTSFVLNERNTPIFAAEAAHPISPDRFEAYASAASAIIADVRRAEGATKTASKRKPDAPLPPPIQASSVAAIGNELYILTATLVQPDFGTASLKHSHAPIVLSGMIIDKEFLASFEKRFMLRQLHVHPGDSTFEANEAHAPLLDARGNDIATVDWTPQNPGRAMRDRIVGPILAVVCLLGVMALVLYRQSRRAAQGLLASEARTAHLAYYDSLTGFPNRVLFFDRLGQALSAARRNNQSVAVLCIDLDRFKEVNDTFGHQSGDELIQEAARRMAGVCRTSDTFARLAGDEFAIVQVNADAASASALAKRLNAVMSEPIDLGPGRVFVGCSVGIAVVAEGGLESVEALRRADLAVYRAKQDGRGGHAFFEIEMDAAIKTRRKVEDDLRDALSNGQLRMAYQPQVNARGVISGVEALVRWTHPERGEISPGYFVPIAEECGLIVPLGVFTLRRAFEDSKRWPNLKIAINVSANQLRLKDFVAVTSALVTEIDVDPRQFELEITEGVLLGDDPATHETLRQLRELGFSLALDDFGTGYSSLSYLRRYPISKIKIDRSFVTTLGADAEAGAVVAAIVKLARALHLAVIAEGVETNDQRAHLVAAGCSDAQGYLFGRPTSAEEIDRLWKSRLHMPVLVHA